MPRYGSGNRIHSANTASSPVSAPLTRLRTRPIGAGNLRAFAAVARHLNFRAAAEELALTQSAVSRQIQALEDEVGVALFLRHTRAVELTGAGAQLLRAVAPSLERLDTVVRQIRQAAGRKTVSISTWASFASMWLIPRLEAFQRAHPDIDIRIDASDTPVDLETADVDLALRYAPSVSVPRLAERLFGEQLTPVASPWLLRNGEPKRWLYLNYAHQIAQAALAGQGVALARVPLVADALAGGDLIEVLPEQRMDSPLAYWLLVGPRSGARPEVQAFCDWMREQAALTREVLGEGASA